MLLEAADLGETERFRRADGVQILEIRDEFDRLLLGHQRHAPQRGQQEAGSRGKKSPRQPLNAVRFDLSPARLAGGQHHQLGREPQLFDFLRLEIAVVPGVGRQQNRRRPRLGSLGKGMSGQEKNQRLVRFLLETGLGGDSLPEDAAFLRLKML